MTIWWRLFLPELSETPMEYNQKFLISNNSYFFGPRIIKADSNTCNSDRKAIFTWCLDGMWIIIAWRPTSILTFHIAMAKASPRAYRPTDNYATSLGETKPSTSTNLILLCPSGVRIFNACARLYNVMYTEQYNANWNIQTLAIYLTHVFIIRLSRHDSFGFLAVTWIRF